MAKTSKEAKQSSEAERQVEIPPFLTVQELADLLETSGVELIKQ